MNILVTGANGFLGSNVVRYLLKERHSLYLFSKNKNNIQDILPHVKYSSAHTHEFSQYRNDIERFNPDVVIHFGWSGGNSYSNINDLTQVVDNIQPGVEFIKLLSTLPKKPKFVGLGSFAEYGTYDSLVDETVQEVPINLYGLSKYTFKKYSEMLCNMYGMQWAWIRPCYTYGPADVPTRLIPSLISKFIINEDIVLDECTTVVDYIYIDDFTKLIHPVITTEITGTYNICSGTQYELKNIVNTLKTLTGSSSTVKYDSNKNRTAIPKYICGSNKKITKLTNINFTDLKKGLLKTIEYEKSRNSKER